MLNARFFFSICIVLVFGDGLKAQLNITSAKTSGNWAQYYVDSILLGAGVVAFNATFTSCDTFQNGIGADSNQIGEFTSSTPTVQIPSGVMLSSGNVEFAMSPSTANTDVPGVNDMASDPDLAQIVTPQLHNRAVLEFDFIPQGDSIKFDYIFGSEEYPDFVCSNFNDVFGFFLSGPGIAGPFTNGAVNLALVPGTSIPVAINTINDVPGGTSCAAPGCPCNSEYFVNNYTTTDTSNNINGLTTRLTARYAVNCNDTYHIKLATADAGDGSYDSYVFLEGGSFSATPIAVSIATVNGDSTINEGCGTAEIKFTRDNVLDTTYTPITFVGTATNGVDFTLIPDTIVMYPGQLDTTIVINPFADGLSEGVEFVTITTLTITACGDTITSSGTLYIFDLSLLTIESSPDTSFDCLPDSFLLGSKVQSGGPAPYSYSWNIGGTADSILFQPSEGPGIDTLIVAIQDSCLINTTFDTILVFKNYPLSPQVTILNDSLVNCSGESLDLVASINFGTAPFAYLWSNGDTNDTLPVTVSSDTSYSVTIEDFCGIFSIDTAFLGVKAADSVSLGLPNEFTYCEGFNLTVRPEFQGGVSPLSFSWDQSNPVFDDDSILVITLNQDTTLFFWVQDVCGRFMILLSLLMLFSPNLWKWIFLRPKVNARDWNLKSFLQ